MLWLAAMDSRLEKDEMGEVQARTAEAFERLRLGFELSVVTVVLFMLSPFGLNFLFVLAPATYFLGIYERAKAWSLLGFEQTETVMWLCAFLLAVSPLSWILAEFWSASYSNIVVDVGFLGSAALWGFYTAVESHNVRELEKKFGLNVRRGRISALCGILTVTVVYSLALFSKIPWAFLILPFISVIFASPFLIFSCIVFIRRLKLK